MSFINNDLNIFYSGGSGGFYLLHYILLFKKHWCNFHHSAEFNLKLLDVVSRQYPESKLNKLRLTEQAYNNCAAADWPDYQHYYHNYPQGIADSVVAELKNLHQQWAYNVSALPGGFDLEFDLIRQHQWNVDVAANWKHNEHFPVNDITAQSNLSDRPHKVFFTCNFIDEWLKYPGKKVVIYTDIQSQLELSKSKKSFIYNTFGDEEAEQRSKKMIEFALPYNEHTVFKPVVEQALPAADHVIYLQDLIRNPEQVLNIDITQQHKDFTQQWLGLHSDALLSSIGLSK